MRDQSTKVKLTEPQKIWLRGLYSHLSKGKQIDVRSLKIELLNQLPKNFNPSEIDSRLLRSDVNLTIIGIGLLDPDSNLINKTNKVLQGIREVLLQNPKTERINVQEISNLTEVAEDQVAVVFEKLSYVGLFHNSGTSYGPVGWASINVSEQAFDSFLKYENVEQIVRSVVADEEDMSSHLRLLRPRIPLMDIDSRKIFIVHGHDEGLKNEVALSLSRLSLPPIILHEQTGKGRTIIEKFEAYSLVPYAVVLLTPDDIGGKEANDLKPRARQNVVLELGYFYGTLRREFVCCLNKGVEIPSDSLGIEYIPYDASGAWKIKLAKELSEVFEIDMNRLQ
jgi:predicted nucleotide-binding protein